MSDRPESLSVWTESSRIADIDAYRETSALETWLRPLWPSASEHRPGGERVSERLAPVTLHEAAHALMNV